MTRSATPKFLLVEDDEVDREAMERGFSAVGAPDCLTIVNDGIEALSTLREWSSSGHYPKPFVVIADLNMPRMNGIEFLRSLRADPAMSNSIVFVCTTSSSESDRQDAFRYHVAGFISKSRVGTQWDRVARMLLEYWALTEKPV